MIQIILHDVEWAATGRKLAMEWKKATKRCGITGVAADPAAER